MKTLGWSEVLNAQKLPWYLANHGIENRVFYMLAKHLPGKNIMIVEVLYPGYHGSLVMAPYSRYNQFHPVANG
jgi:hypothetical protein